MQWSKNLEIDRPQTTAIDDVHKATAKAQDSGAQAEGKKIVEAIAKLKYELQHDRQLR